MAYTYNWESTIFASSDEVLYGYPFPKASTNPIEFDIDSVYSVWSLSPTILYGYPVSSPKVIKFDLSKVFSNWTDSSNDLFGYVVPRDCKIYKSGAFAHTTEITSLQFPISVIKLGEYTCYDSAITSVQVSPLCEFYSTTFPDNCTITYYTVSIDTITFPITPLEFVVGDDYNAVLDGTTVLVTVSDGTDSITTYAKNFTITDIDTSTEVSDATGYVNVITSTGSIACSESFTYSVVAATT